MSNPNKLLPNLDRSNLHTTVKAPEFAAMVQSHFGTDISPNDGFDQALSAVIGELDGDAGVPAALDLNLSAAAFNQGDFSSAVYSPVAADYGDTIANGEGQVDILPPGQ